jgi:hypothetical protein
MSFKARSVDKNPTDIGVLNLGRALELKKLKKNVSHEEFIEQRRKIVSGDLKQRKIRK